MIKTECNREKVVLLILVMIGFINLKGQTRNLHIEGIGDQYGRIEARSSQMFSSKTGLELIRSTGKNNPIGTDWRIVNDGGFIIEDANDNFATDGDVNMRITKNGNVFLYNGNDAEASSSLTGTLILGDPQSFNIALDNNGIIARNGNIGSRLLIQTGLDKGDTYLNNLSGNVGVGTITPGAKLGIADNQFQMHLENNQQLTNDWYIGASHDNWLIGGDKLVISPTVTSTDAILVLDRVDRSISAENNRIVKVADPIGNLNAVNLRTLNNSINDAITDNSFISPKQITSTTVQDMSFEECATYCRTLDSNGFTDWTIPSLEDASHFSGITVGSQPIWTSAVESYYTTTLILVRITLNLQSGDVNWLVENSNLDSGCRCVR